MPHHNLVVLQTFGNALAAELAKTALQSAGIQAMIQADTAGGMRPHLAWSGDGFRLVVREDDAAMARGVLFPLHLVPPPEEQD